MGDIGKPLRRVDFEPVDIPADAPMEAAPVVEPAPALEPA